MAPPGIFPLHWTIVDCMKSQIAGSGMDDSSFRFVLEVGGDDLFAQ